MSPEPFSAAQAMAAFNQRNGPFGTQVVKLAAGGEPKDWLASEVKDAKSFWTTVTGTAPSVSDEEIARFIQNNPETYNLALLSAAENWAAGKASPPAPSTPAPSTPTSSTPAPTYSTQQLIDAGDFIRTSTPQQQADQLQQLYTQGVIPSSVDMLRAVKASVEANPTVPSTPDQGWSTQQIADAGTFIAKHLNDPAKIEAKRKEIEQATGRDISVSDILAASKAANLSVSGALADIWSGDKYGPITTQDYYNWINQGVMDRPEFSGQEAQAAMKHFGISGEDITRARALDPRFSAGAQFALTTPTYEESGKTGFAALNQKLRDYIQQNAGAIKPEQARERLTQMLAAGTLTGGQALNEYDVQRATGKTLDELFKEATKPNPFVPPPPIDIPAAPSRPVNKIDVPGIDTAFREGPVRTFNPATGTFQYTNPTKLTPATGSGTTWVPPVITSRQRQLLNVGFRDDITTPTYDAVSNMLYQPAASSSQRFAADRSAQMRALQQLRTSVPMGSSTFLQLQSRLRSGEFGGVGGRPVDAAALEAAAKGYAAPTTKVATIGDKYFEKYPDVAAEYARFDAATKARFPTPSDYAQYHYETYGRNESPAREMPTLFAHGGPVVKKQSGGDVSRGTSSPNTAEVPSVDFKGDLIDENAEMRSEAQRMLNRLKTAQQESYRRGKLPPGIQRAVTDVMSEEKPPLVRGSVMQAGRDIVGGVVGATPTELTNPSNLYRFMQAATGAALPEIPMARTAQAARVAAQEPRATMSAAGRSARESLEALADIPIALAQPNQLGSQAGAVRPYGKGTVFSGVKLANDWSVGSSLDNYIDQGKSAAFSVPDVDTADAIRKFFDTKARRYMSTQLGTQKDPVFNAIKEGQISNLSLHDIPGLRKYAIAAAKEGKFKTDKKTGEFVLNQYGQRIFYPKDPQAVMDVTKAYDEMVDIKPMSFKPGLVAKAYNTDDPLYQAEFERVREQMRQAFEDEGFDSRLVNLTGDPMVLTSARDTGEPYYAGYTYRMDDFIKDKLSGDPEAMKGVPENIRRALDQNELLYDVSVKQGVLKDILDPENMANYLATLSPREIDKIRFEDAVVGSAKFNREKIDRQFEGQRLKELVASGKAPDKVFSKGVSEPLLQFGEDQRHPGFAWKRLEDLEATVTEGAYMNHSVGGYLLGGIGYGPKATKGFQEGTHKIYSLRNVRNRPVTTIQVIDEGSKDNPFLVVKQIKGNGVRTGNTAPVDYDEEVYDFLTQVVKPDAIEEKDQFLTPLLIQYRDALEANRQTR